MVMVLWSGLETGGQIRRLPKMRLDTKTYKERVSGV